MSIILNTILFSNNKINGELFSKNLLDIYNIFDKVDIR